MPNLGEVAVLWAVTAVAASSALLGAPTVIRVIFGIPLVLFIPGYALTTTLFPSRTSLDGIERVALSFGLSIAVVSLVALAIDVAPTPIALGPLVAGLAASVFTFTIAGAWRRGRLPAEQRANIGLPRLSLPAPAQWDATTRAGAIIIAVSVLIFASAALALLAARSPGDPMTEFAIYNSDGGTEHYPRDIADGETETMIVAITNQEHRSMSYWLRIRAGDHEIARVAGIKLEHGAQWREAMPITVVEPVDEIPILFELFRAGEDNESAPYRVLRLNVRVFDHP